MPLPETSKSPASAARQGKFINTSTSTQRGVSASVRLHTGDPDLVACDMIVVAYRRWGYRQLRREHVARFEALTGTLSDTTMLRLRDQIAADGGPAVAMLDTAPQDGLIKLTVIENCGMSLYRRKSDCWQTARACPGAASVHLVCRHASDRHPSCQDRIGHSRA